MSGEPVYLIRPGGESTGPAGTYLVWHWKDEHRCVEITKSLQEALDRAHLWRCSPHGDFDLVEGPTGVVPGDEVHAWMRAENETELQRWHTEQENRSATPLWEVDVRHPHGDEISYLYTGDEQYARRAAANLSPPGRVRISTFYAGETRVIKDWNDPL
jgi:hypothetical protein